MNIASLLIDKPAALHADRVAIIVGTCHVTYGELLRCTNRIAKLLMQLGCAPGDRVLLSVNDSPESIAALLAVLKLGGIVVPVQSNVTPVQYKFYLNDTGAVIAIFDQSSLLNIRQAEDDPAVKVLELKTDQQVSETHVKSDSDSARLGTYPASFEDPALILYTSGSTATQKPAVHCHGNVFAAIDMIGRDAFGIQSGDVILCSARLFFAFGLGFGVYLPLGMGASTILLPTRDLDALLHAISSLKPHIFCGVPSLLDSVIRVSSKSSKVDLSSLRFVVSAGEPLPPKLFDAYKDLFGLEVLDGVGSTEMLTHFITNLPGRARRGSCGTVVTGCEAMLVDENNNPVPDGEIGALQIRSKTRFLGYWQEYRSAESNRSEIFETGDRLYRDSAGFYYYCGRKDDMLKVFGLWVMPREIETVLLSHPQIQKCAVTTREDDQGRRRLVAYLVWKRGSALSPLDLYRYVEQQLPAHMIPTVFMAVQDLPLTPTGKLNRQALPTPEWRAA